MGSDRPGSASASTPDGPADPQPAVNARFALKQRQCSLQPQGCPDLVLIAEQLAARAASTGSDHRS